MHSGLTVYGGTGYILPLYMHMCIWRSGVGGRGRLRSCMPIPDHLPISKSSFSCQQLIHPVPLLTETSLQCRQLYRYCPTVRGAIHCTFVAVTVCVLVCTCGGVCCVVGPCSLLLLRAQERHTPLGVEQRWGGRGRRRG